MGERERREKDVLSPPGVASYNQNTADSWRVLPAVGRTHNWHGYEIQWQRHRQRMLGSTCTDSIRRKLQFFIAHKAEGEKWRVGGIERGR